MCSSKSGACLISSLVMATFTLWSSLSTAVTTPARRDSRSGACSRKEIAHLAVQRGVGRQRLTYGRTSVERRHDRARLDRHELARGDVPRREAPFVEDVDATAR